MKAPSDLWSGADVPRSQLQISAYLNTCTSWLTSEPDSVDRTLTSGEFEEYTSIAVHPSHVHTSGFAFSYAEGVRRECALCNRLSTAMVAVIANPFTHNCRISLCESCRNVPNDKP